MLYFIFIYVILFAQLRTCITNDFNEEDEMNDMINEKVPDVAGN